MKLVFKQKWLQEISITQLLFLKKIQNNVVNDYITL